MRRTKTRSAGFTMIEVVITIAVVAILAAVLVPMISQNIQSARHARAASDVATLGKAIVQFRQDTSLWPIYSAAVPMNLLYSDTAATIPPTWDVDGGGQNLSMATHLMAYNINAVNAGITNGPSTTGTPSWNGPYLSGLSADPWGNSYVVNCQHLSTGAGNVYVLSAGPGRPANIETPFNGAPPGGSDDIFFQIQ